MGRTQPWVCVGAVPRHQREQYEVSSIGAAQVTEGQSLGSRPRSKVGEFAHSPVLQSGWTGMMPAQCSAASQFGYKLVDPCPGPAGW